MLYPSCTGLSFIRCVFRYLSYLLKLFINASSLFCWYFVGILLWMCPSVLFKNVRGLFIL